MRSVRRLAGRIAGGLAGSFLNPQRERAGEPTRVPKAFMLAVVTMILFATSAAAAVTATPSSVTVIQGQTSSTITLNLTYNGSGFPGTGTIAVTGLPSGTTTNPSPVTYNHGAQSTSATASTTFTFVVGASTPVGTYNVTFTDTKFAAGSATVQLTVSAQPSFTATASPNPVTLTAGGSVVPVTVTTTRDPGFGSASITYSFTGFPGFINTGGPQTTDQASNFAPRTFNFSAAAGATPGTYSGMLVGTYSVGVGAMSKTFPFTVIVQQTDISATFTPPFINMCDGGTASTTLQLAPVNGYSGTPQLRFTNVPAGLTITPANPTASPMPPPSQQSIPFTISANGISAGTYNITLNIADAAAGINKNAVFTVNIGAADFAPSVTPAAVTTPSGGAAQPLSAVITPIGCFNSPVTVVASSTTPGLTVTPSSATLTSPTYAPATFSVQASSAVAAGTYPVTFIFTSPGVAKSVVVQVTVSASPDFSISVAPTQISASPGDTRSVTVSATGTNGFSGPITVTAPSIAGVTFTPSTFVITPGASQPVTITFASSVVPQTIAAVFSATSPGVTGTREATVTIAITPRPDFRLTAVPSSLTITAGGSGTVVVSATGLNGFSGPINVTAATPAQLTATPATFVLLPGASQTVTLSAGAIPSTANPFLVTFAGTAAQVTGTRTTQVSVNVRQPLPVVTAVLPTAVITGTRSTVLRVQGSFFQNGATILPANDLTIESVTILSPTLADVTVSVREDATPGPRLLRLRNPDGGTSATGVTLLVYPSTSLAAPLGVTAAAIVFPGEGTIIAGHEAVYPRALLATTGVGTIIGSWHFDGVPFDRFVTTVSSGFPADIRAHVPIPTSFAGGHRLELVIESPQHAVSPAINVIAAIDSASRLRVLAPRDGSVIDVRTLFRWSLVPNTSGYLVELRKSAPAANDFRPDELIPAVKIRLADSQWKPTAEQLRALSTGVHSWRVRAMFPGETPGEPTPWQRFVVTPDRVDLVVLRASRGDISWSGGVTGLLYRVDFIAPDGRVMFSGLTSRDTYRLPAGVAPPAPGSSVRITALGPGGSVIGTSPAAPMSPQSRRSSGSAFIPVADLQVTKQEPRDGASTKSRQPTITAQWIGKVEAEEVSLVIDETDVTAVTTLTPSSASYASLLPLSPGEHTVRLGLRETVTTWRFKVEEETAAAATTEPPPLATLPEGEVPQPNASRVSKDWLITPIGTLTLVDDENLTIDPRDARLQISTQTDIANPSATAKVTGDLSLKHQMNDPNKTVQESRSWITSFGARQGNYYAQQAIIGYAGPDFLDQLELLSSGVARGGAEGKLLFPIGTAAYYESMNSLPVGVVAGNFGPQQKVRAFSYQVPTNAKWDFRLIGMNVTDEPGFNSAGGKGRAYGLFAKYTNSPAFGILVEAARGGFDPNAGSGERDRRGTGIRFGFSGTIGTFNYLATLRKTDADFVNPANRGFTPGGVPDRTGGTLALSKVFGRTSISAQMRHLQDGNASGALIPRTRESGGNVSLTAMLGQRVSFTIGGNRTTTSGEALESLFLPKSDRSQSGWNGTFTETLGQFAFVQSVTWQELRDAVNPIANQKMTAATFTAGGNVNSWFNLSGVGSFTRSAGARTVVGTTDQRLISLQPTLSIPRLWLSFQPRLTYSHSENDLSHGENQAEAIQSLLSWAPPWLNQLASLQFSADWTRNKYTGQVVQPGFVRRYAATFSLRSSAGSGVLSTAPGLAVLPGVMPIAPPTSSTPVTNQQK